MAKLYAISPSSAVGKACAARPKSAAAPDGYMWTGTACVSRTRPKGNLVSAVSSLVKKVAPVAALALPGLGTAAVTALSRIAPAAKAVAAVQRIASAPIVSTATKAAAAVQRIAAPVAPVIRAAVSPVSLPPTRSTPVALIPTVATVARTVAQVALTRSGSNMVTSGTPAALTTAARVVTAGAAAGAVSSAARGVISTIQRLVPGGATGLSSPSCPPGTFKGPAGTCVDLMPGGSTSGGGMIIGRFDPIMGMYGAGLLPGRENRTVHFCPPGMVLGKDDVCYNRGQLGKKNRKHNPGFRPPITGGDVSAIRRAASAKKRVAKLGRGVGLFVANRRPEGCGKKKK